MVKLAEVRKEDDIYHQGPFWIIGESFTDILRGNFDLIGSKFECTYNGDYLDNNRSKSQRTHKKIWETDYKNVYDQEDYTYYPRGRVSVYNGIAWIHINSKCNIPKIIDRIVKEYNLSKLELEIDLNDVYQGSHYNFKLK